MTAPRLIAFLTISLIVTAHSSGEAESPNSLNLGPAYQTLKRDVKRLKSKYRMDFVLHSKPDLMQLSKPKRLGIYDYISPDSPDFLTIESLGEAANESPDFIHDLIDLTPILQPPPTSTEKFGGLSLSPAGRQLVGLRGKAKPVIEARLLKGDVNEWQKRVLGEVLWQIEVGEMRERDPKVKVPPSPFSPLDKLGDFILQFPDETREQIEIKEQQSIAMATNARVPPPNARDQSYKWIFLQTKFTSFEFFALAAILVVTLGLIWKRMNAKG